MRIIHWPRRLRKTGKLPRSERPSAVTSSFDSTVPRPGHQLTIELERYTRRRASSARSRSTRSRSAHVRPANSSGRAISPEA